MSIRSDLDKVLAARAQLQEARSLPERYWANCCYSDESRHFIETHLLTLDLIADHVVMTQGLQG